MAVWDKKGQNHNDGIGMKRTNRERQQKGVNVPGGRTWKIWERGVKRDDDNDKANTCKNMDNRSCLLSADWTISSRGKQNNISARDRMWEKSDFNEKSRVLEVPGWLYDLKKKP